MKQLSKTFLLLLISGMIVSWSAYAAWTPEESIKVLVGFKAGGGVDTLARVVSQKVAENTGWTIVVVNKTGGGGSVMAKSLKKAKPDGYTIGFAPGENFTFNPTINPRIGFTLHDFTHLAAISVSQCGLFSMSDKPWTTLADAIEAAKSGEEISVAYQAPKMGMSMKAIEKVFGVSLKLVPVKGGNGGVKNVLGGHVDIAWGAGIQAKYVKAGQMKILASCEKERIAMAPEAPTVRELGVKYVNLDAKFQFSAPGNLPADIAEAYVREIRRATGSKDIQDLIANKLSLKLIFTSGKELQKDLEQSLTEAQELVEFVKN